MPSENELQAEYIRLVHVANDQAIRAVRDAYDMISIIPRIYDDDRADDRIYAGVVLDLKFKSGEEAQDPDPRLVTLLEKLVGRRLHRYPDNPAAFKDSLHAFYTVEL